MIDISELKNKHFGQPAFCLGTAPHLNDLDLNLIKDFVSIGCNQLTACADKYKLDYICFQRDERFQAVKDSLGNTIHPDFIIPVDILKKNINWDIPKGLEERISPCHNRFTSPGHAEFFSFNLNNYLYVNDSVTMEVQLAVWMGCNPIYILGVDAKYTDPNHPFFDDSFDSKEDRERSEKYVFPELCELFTKIKTLLWSKGVKLYNAAGEFSSLEVLPKVRLRSAVNKPKIAITSKTFSNDEYLVNELRRYFSDIKINTCSGKLQGSELIDFLKDSDGMILGTEPFGVSVIEALPCLRFVSKYGVGLNNIDFQAAKRHAVEIVFKKGVNSDSVAELTLAFTLMLLRKIDNTIAGYRNGNWSKLPGKELAEITLGIIGYGHVGKVVAKKFLALGIKRLLVNDLTDFPNIPPYEFVPLDYLLEESDVVSLHVSMEKNNYHMVNEKFIDKMKKGSFLINTSRGDILAEKALVTALKKGQLGGAGIDVYENEPLINKELASCANLLTTCHIAGSSNRAIKNMGWAAIEGLLRLLNKNPY